MSRFRQSIKEITPTLQRDTVPGLAWVSRSTRSGRRLNYHNIGEEYYRARLQLHKLASDLKAFRISERIHEPDFPEK